MSIVCFHYCSWLVAFILEVIVSQLGVAAASGVAWQPSSEGPQSGLLEWVRDRDRCNLTSLLFVSGCGIVVFEPVRWAPIVNMPFLSGPIRSGPFCSGPFWLGRFAISATHGSQNSMDLMVGERKTYSNAFPHPCPPSPAACMKKQKELAVEAKIWYMREICYS